MSPWTDDQIDLSPWLPFRAVGTLERSSPWLTLLAARQRAAEKKKETP